MLLTSQLQRNSFIPRIPYLQIFPILVESLLLSFQQRAALCAKVSNTTFFFRLFSFTD